MEKEISKLKNRKEFAKLFKVPIPYEEEFVYYVQTLSKSREYWHLYNAVLAFNDFEQWIKESSFEDIGQYKMKYAMPKLMEYIQGTKAYAKFQEVDYSKDKFYSKDHLKQEEGRILISFDLQSANYHTIASFDNKGIGSELGNNWEELCKRLDIHPTLTASKSFRQVVFGNLNPKRNQKLQHAKMTKLADKIVNLFGEDRLVFLSHDEMVLMPDHPELEFMSCNSIREVMNAVNTALEGIESATPLKATIFKMTKIQKGIYLKDIYDIHEQPTILYSHKHISSFMPPPKYETLQHQYKTLYGAPGSKYFQLFKKYVLEEPLDERDLYFVNDGNLAKWVR